MNFRGATRVDAASVEAVTTLLLVDKPAETNPEPGKPISAASSGGTSVNLLATPDYDAAVERFFWDAVEHTANQVDPVYAYMSKHSIDPNVGGVRVEIAGKVVESPMVSVQYEFTIEHADIRETNLEALRTVIHSTAISKLEQVAEAYSEYMDVAADAVGNNVKLSKDTFTWDTVLDLLEKVEWSEGTDGRVHPPRQISGANVPPLPDRTPEQQRRLEQIDVKKQEEHVARRRSRRLR